MKTIIYQIHAIALCLMLGTALSFSQSTNSDWTAESPLVSINEVAVEIASHLSKTGTNIIWEQTQGTNTDSNTFVITNSSGSWDTQTNLGQLDYDLTLDDTIASLTVIGTSEEITINLTIYQPDGSVGSTYDFDIETFTNL